MDEASSMYPNLSNQTQFRLKKINEIKDHFISELSKYIPTFDYFDKTLIFFSARSSGTSIASFPNVIGAPIEIASASFSFEFSYDCKNC